MNEEKLIQAAQSGDVSAMVELAEYYAQKSKSGTGDKVGDVISLEDFFKSLNEEGNPDFEKKAYEYWLMAAEAGNAEAMTEVGRRLYDAIGVERDNEGSQIWYRRGAEAGDPSAMRVVAFTSEDAAEKFKWYKLSAEFLPSGLNKQDSIKQTAINYACGRGTEKNLAEAEIWLAKLDKDHIGSTFMEIARITEDNSWMERAAEFDSMAMIRLAENFVLKDDFATALTYYKKAANTGSADAMSIIGDIFYIGENGVRQNYEEAFKWYSRAAELDSNMAKVKMTLMLYRGLGVKKDLPRAFRSFVEISRSREKFFGVLRFNSVARYYVAKMLEDGEGCEKSSFAAFRRYMVAGGLKKTQPKESARSIPKAIYKVADAYFLGVGTPRSSAKALECYEKVISQGDGKTPYHREAMKKIICMYEIGEDIPQDKAKADEWREKLNSSQDF